MVLRQNVSYDVYGTLCMESEERTHKTESNRSRTSDYLTSDCCCCFSRAQMRIRGQSLVLNKSLCIWEGFQTERVSVIIQ